MDIPEKFAGPMIRHVAVIPNVYTVRTAKIAVPLDRVDSAAKFVAIDA